ncbi:MAG: class IV adenylate cyclase [Patescibacteria group bacterium]
MTNKEIEVRFLEIDEKAIQKKLKNLGAQDEGEDILKETIFYDKEGRFVKEHKFVRLREGGEKTLLAYKHHISYGAHITSIENTIEIEFGVSDPKSARRFLEELGLIAYREQEKKRHKYKLGKVTLDIDTWPKIPTYLEIEAPSEKELKETARQLGLSWKDAFFHSAREVLEKYKIPITTLKYFTFKKIE